MKSKRTIRKMHHTPLARSIALRVLELRSLEHRLDHLTEEIATLELEHRIYRQALEAHGWDTGDA